jgi:hypothetical protein
MARLFLITIASMILLWIAQWLFWTGFIGLSMEEYVLMRARTGFNLADCIKVLSPKLGVLTIIWIGSSLAVATVAVLP